MVVRTVNIDQPFAQRAECLQRGRRAIDELLVRAGIGEGPLEHELAVFAWLQSVLIEEGSQRRLEFAHVKDGFHRTAVRATANERAIRAFAEDKIERANENGFTGTGLAGDHVQARLQLERQVGDEREVLDSERGQHDGISWRRIWRLC